MTPGKILFGQIIVVLLVVLAGVWSATQWAASMLGHQPELGAPWFTFAGLRVYSPWRIFIWWFFFDAYAPAVFAKAGALAAGSGILAAMVAVLGSTWRARQAKQVTTYGSARFASMAEIRQAGLLSDAGVFLGCAGRRYLRHAGPEHVMAFAPTRSGKGVGLVVPTLLSWTGSAVIHDIKGENWQLTAGWRAKFSHCLLFNPTDPKTARYNPLLEVRKGPNEVRDVENIADILVDPEGSREQRNHWERTAHALLVGSILHVLYAEPDKTLSGVANLLSDPGETFETTLRRMLHANHLGTVDRPRTHPRVASAVRDLLNMAENERSGVVSTARTFLAVYRDPLIAQATSHSDWRIADLVEAEHPLSLYLVMPPSDLARTRPLVRLLLNQLGRRLTETLAQGKGKGPRHQLLLMLDEFPALGRLDFFETALAFIAGYGIRAYLIAQSLNQVTKAYGDNNAILDNCHVRIAFASNDERTAKRISDSLGTATELREQKNYAGHRLAPWLAHVMVSRQETARPLLTPGEIMQLPANQALVLLGGTPPIRATKLRYYQDQNFTQRLLPPPELDAGDYADKPAARPDDWSDLASATSAASAGGSAASIAKGCATEADTDEGGPAQQIELPVQAEPTEPEHAADALELIDDDTDDALDLERSQQERRRQTIRRAAVLDHDDDLLPL
ncbi:MAG: conjugal transfer protein TraG [Alphaproteobacteria bacterium]